MFRVALHPVGGYVLTGAIIALLVTLLIVLPLRTPLAKNRRRILVALRLGVMPPRWRSSRQTPRPLLWWSAMW